MAGQPKIRMSEIRAKFPMYRDVSDEQLLIGLRKKHYADIPMADFVSAIEFDTAADPTEGMSGTEKFLAGAGKAFADLGRGAGQLVGLVSREDVEAARKRDEPLMQSGAGLAGNLTGNLAALAPAALIPGAATLPGAAAIGAATGLIAPSSSTGETAANVGLGGVAGPAGLAAGRVLGAAYQGGKAILAPFTPGGREKITANTLKRFAGNDLAKAAGALDNPEIFVPGSQPTVGELTENAGLAQLQRTLRNADPSLTDAFTQRDLANQAARTNVLRDIAGDPGKREFFEASRKTAANELYGRAFEAGIDPAAITPQVQARMDALLSRPSIKQAQRIARQLAAEEGVALDDMGSVQGLHYVKKALDDMIASTGPGGIGPTKQRALQGTQNQLIEVLDEISPDYAEARRTYQAMSRPINQMDVGQELYDRARPALADYGAMTRESSASFAKALRDADQTAARATGFKGAKLADVMEPEQMAALEGVARDLARKANANELGRAAGSNTAQNLVSDNLLAQLGGPFGLREGGTIHTVLATVLGRPVQWIAHASQPQLQSALAEAMLDPQRAAQLLRLVQLPNASQRLGMAAERFLAPASAAGALQAQGGQ